MWSGAANVAFMMGKSMAAGLILHAVWLVIVGQATGFLISFGRGPIQLALSPGGCLGTACVAGVDVQARLIWGAYSFGPGRHLPPFSILLRSLLPSAYYNDLALHAAHASCAHMLLLCAAGTPSCGPAAGAVGRGRVVLIAVLVKVFQRGFWALCVVLIL